MYLVSRHTVIRLDTIAWLICLYGRNSYARRLNCISHIERTHTRWLEWWVTTPLVVLNGQGTWDAMLGDVLVWFLGCVSLFLFLWALSRYLSYGVYRAWSIWTMPAILRIFLTKMIASTTHIGSYAQNERTVGWGGSDLDSMECLQHYEVSTLDIYYGCIGHSPTGTRWHNRTWMIVAYNPIYGRGW